MQDDEVTIAFNKEMEALERQQRNLRDQYNTLEKNRDLDDYKRIINASDTADYALKKGQQLKSWTDRLDVHVEKANALNWKIHVIIGSHGKPFYSHKNPNGCFMCDDANLIKYLLSVLQHIANKYPKLIIK